VTTGLCCFNHNDETGKPAIARAVYIDGEGNEKEVCALDFVRCIETEIKAKSNEKLIARMKKERLERLKSE
jgi:hypothetical protein